MAVTVDKGVKVWRRRDRGAQLAIWAAWLVAAGIFVYCWELISDKTVVTGPSTSSANSLLVQPAIQPAQLWLRVRAPSARDFCCTAAFKR